MSKIRVKKPCTFSLKEKENVRKTGRTKSYSELSEGEACGETEIINSGNMDDSNDIDVLSAGCAPASLTGVESVEKSSEQEIISQEQSQIVYEDHCNGPGVNTLK